MNRMIPVSREGIATFARGISLRQVRLASGMVLFAYLVSHFLNHALGNVSMDALQAGVAIHAGIWQFFPIAVIFYGSAAIHAALGIWALYERRQFRWATAEPLQLVLVTLATCFGSLGLSHVNDAGFWVVTRYLGLSVPDGLKTWTVLTTIRGVTGFLITWLLWFAL